MTECRDAYRAIERNSEYGALSSAAGLEWSLISESMPRRQPASLWPGQCTKKALLTRRYRERPRRFPPGWAPGEGRQSMASTRSSKLATSSLMPSRVENIHQLLRIRPVHLAGGRDARPQGRPCERDVLRAHPWEPGDGQPSRGGATTARRWSTPSRGFSKEPRKTTGSRWTDSIEMNHVEARILGLVTELFPDVFRTLDKYSHGHGDYLDPAPLKVSARALGGSVTSLLRVPRQSAAGSSGS